MKQTAVNLQNVYKTYNKLNVVNNLSFAIEAGEIFSLLGPNGAGKSTTIRAIATLTAPSGGTIEVGGYDVTRYPLEVKRQIGVVLQQISVDGELSVWENMEFHGRMHHIPNPFRQRQIDRWLEYVELYERRNQLVKNLSGGMKRRLQIARAMLHQPKILVLDEPTVGLDPQTRRRLWEIIRDLNRQGMTILLTTHYMEEVEFLSQECATGKSGRIGIMDGGKLIELGTLSELRSQFGRGILVKQIGDRLEYKFFPELENARTYVDSLGDSGGFAIRESNLEDIFVKLTGHDLRDNA
jgi:ABC-2 type transport system ATP-binding protein